jgi:hypothetical protein
MTLAELEKFLREHDCRMMASLLGQDFMVVFSVKGFEVARSKAKTLEAAIASAVMTSKFPAAR